MISSASGQDHKIARSAYGKILLVGKDQEHSITQLVFVQHPLQFLTCLDNTISVIAVDNKDDALSVLEVMSPQGPDLILSTDVPHCELNILVFDGFDVEACWEGRKLGFRDDQIFNGGIDSPMVGIVVLLRSAGQPNKSCGVDLHNLAQLQFVQDGSFTGCIKTDHQDSHLLLPP